MLVQAAQLQSNPSPVARTSRPAPLLKVMDVGVRFGGIVALNGVSFEIGVGEICGVIGPNGAGKTTLLNCLSRIYDCGSGHIEFAGKTLTGLPRHAIAPLGIGRTFQNLALFKSMSVRENVMVGLHCQTSTGFLANALGLPRVRNEETIARRRAQDLLTLLNLESVA